MRRSPEHPGMFHTTRWSIVLAAGQAPSPDSRAALAELCETYWPPLYGYVKRRVTDVHRAQDLTQEFFARLLEQNVIAVAQPDRGRFRSFLLTALQNFLTNEAIRSQTRKHGGQCRVLSLDFAACDSRQSLEPQDRWTPERLYERQWVITLLDVVLERLRRECETAGRGEHYEKLKPFLGGTPGEESLAQVAERLGLSPEAGRQAARRLRLRYRQLLRDEVARTVADPGDVDEELGRLFAALE